MNAATNCVTTRPVRLACIGCTLPNRFVAMDSLRLVRMAEAMARRGHMVDIVHSNRAQTFQRGARLRDVPLKDISWADYDVVKTLFHEGFDRLQATGGGDHPFVVSKLGSVVGRDHTDGVHFHGTLRDKLFATQTEIARRSRFVTILTHESIALWRKEHGEHPPVLLVPTGVDADIPPQATDPVRALGIDEPVVMFAGHLYSLETQPEVNRIWQDRLNRLGFALRRRGLRLVAMGPGVTDQLDPRAVLHVGTVDAHAVWDWQRAARVGVSLGQGTVQHNESSKVYYYLRTGLPVVCERPIPNAWLVDETGHGVVTDYDDVEAMAEAAASLAANPPPADDVIELMITQHSWDARAAQYDQVFAEAALEGDRRLRSEMAG